MIWAKWLEKSWRSKAKDRYKWHLGIDYCELTMVNHYYNVDLLIYLRQWNVKTVY